ncbi:unnamed protein product [Linum tenue]|uniref:NAD-dependent epimerase/dehydratase domain-containing protein n=1 Tax=Linum tenue TaxID=586396 RepID=A0AAV0PIP6_9ROSI|nr:unnamed protein product [Linum tenue]
MPAADISSSPAGGGHGQTVCVTGAGGFIASWIVKLLLARGYSVRGTADLLDYNSLGRAISGCHGVFHAACPITDDPEQMLGPAVDGTKNVITAASAAKVRRVVFTSSVGAVYMDANRSTDVVMDESYWSDLEYCKDTKVYMYIIFLAKYTCIAITFTLSTNIAISIRKPQIANSVHFGNGVNRRYD